MDGGAVTAGRRAHPDGHLSDVADLRRHERGTESSQLDWSERRVIRTGRQETTRTIERHGSVTRPINGGAVFIGSPGGFQFPKGGNFAATEVQTLTTVVDGRTLPPPQSNGAPRTSSARCFTPQTRNPTGEPSGSITHRSQVSAGLEETTITWNFSCARNSGDAPGSALDTAFVRLQVSDQFNTNGEQERCAPVFLKPGEPLNANASVSVPREDGVELNPRVDAFGGSASSAEGTPDVFWAGTAKVTYSTAPRKTTTTSFQVRIRDEGPYRYDTTVKLTNKNRNFDYAGGEMQPQTTPNARTFVVMTWGNNPKALAPLTKPVTIPLVKAR